MKKVSSQLRQKFQVPAKIIPKPKMDALLKIPVRYPDPEFKTNLMNYHILLNSNEKINNFASNLQLLEQQLEEDLITLASSSLKKYKEVMMGLDKDKWIESVNKDHEQMVQDGIFQVEDAKGEISQEQKAITSTMVLIVHI